MTTRSTASVLVAAIQPPMEPGPLSATNTQKTIQAACGLLEVAGEAGSQVACLPELLNVFGSSPAEALKEAQSDRVAKFLAQITTVSARYQMWVICPVLAEREGTVFNSSLVISPSGEIVGHYDKTHITDAERAWYGVQPGDDFPVFQAPWGTFGIMTCYDGYFPETARILALEGADIIFFPSWGSGPSEIVMDVQMRARAIDQCVYIVRSSFGYERHVAWRPGMFFGRSCIVDRDGTIVADAGHYEGMATAVIDASTQRLMDVLDDGGDVRDLRAATVRDRRPDAYHRLTSEVE